MVVAIGMPVDSARRNSSSCKPKRWISTSARITGRLAAESSAIDSSSASRRASGSLGGRPSGGRCGLTCRARTWSRGSSRYTGRLYRTAASSTRSISCSAVSGLSSTAEATVIFSKTSNCVSNPLTLWCSKGLCARSDRPGEPPSTITGDFSAYAPAMLLQVLSPPTQYVTQMQPSPWIRA